MQTEQTKYLSPQEYLEIERQAEYKSEYYKGEMFALAGSSFKHNLIAHNISAILDNLLKNKDCNILQSDMKVLIEEAVLYTYPDVVVVCGKPEFQNKNEDVLLNPIVIFEILSKSTENYDRGQKFKFYRSLSSLKDYVLISQDKILVENYSRISDKEWHLKEYNALDDKFNITSIDCALQLSEIYYKIDFNTGKNI